MASRRSTTSGAFSANGPNDSCGGVSGWPPRTTPARPVEERGVLDQPRRMRERFPDLLTPAVFVPDDLTPGDYVIKLKLKGEHAGKEVSAKLTVIP